MKRILCVDDNEHNLYMITTLLQRAGYEVIIARTGEEAVAKAAAERPDLVLMDLTLPGIDGCEATRQIKASPETSVTPIIAFSGHSEEDKGALARAAGCIDYARKPIQVRILLSKVHALLSVGEAQTESSGDGAVPG